MFIIHYVLGEVPEIKVSTKRKRKEAKLEDLLKEKIYPMGPSYQTRWE
jgi:hypothetical protein